MHCGEGPHPEASRQLQLLALLHTQPPSQQAVHIISTQQAHTPLKALQVLEAEIPCLPVIMGVPWSPSASQAGWLLAPGPLLHVCRVHTRTSSVVISYSSGSPASMSLAVSSSCFSLASYWGSTT